MDRDATLEDFLDPGDGGSSDAVTGGSTDEKQDDDAPDTEARGDDAPDTEVRDDGAPGTASSTMHYRPSGGACAICGTVVERRWRDDDGLVCRDCKAW